MAGTVSSAPACSVVGTKWGNEIDGQRVARCISLFSRTPSHSLCSFTRVFSLNLSMYTYSL